MSGCVAVFDVGKTNIKVVVFDRGGAVLAERSAPNAPLAPDSEWPYLRLDTEGAWSFLIGALKDLGARFYIEAISPAVAGPQSWAPHFLLRALLPGSIQRGDRVPRLRAIFRLAPRRGDGFGGDLPRRAHRPLAPERGRSLEHGRHAWLPPTLPAETQSLGHARDAQARTRPCDWLVS